MNASALLFLVASWVGSGLATTRGPGLVPKLSGHSTYVLTEAGWVTPAGGATPTLDAVLAAGSTLSTNYTLTLSNNKSQAMRFVDGAGNLLLNLKTTTGNLQVEVGQAAVFDSTVLVSGVLSAGSGPVTLTNATGNILSDALVNGTAVGNLSGTNSGDVSLAAVGSSPSANGASLSGQVLTLQVGDGTHPGLIGTGTQTLGGTYTFSNAPTMSGANVSSNTIPTASLATPAALSAHSGGGQGSAQVLTKGDNYVGTVSGANDSIKLYASPTAGDVVRIINGGSNALELYPCSSCTINNLTSNQGITILSDASGIGTLETCTAMSSTVWACKADFCYQNVSDSGGLRCRGGTVSWSSGQTMEAGFTSQAASSITSGALTVSGTTSLTAGTTQTQAGATQCTNDVCVFTTVANNSDGGRMATPALGTRQTIVNLDTTHTMKLYPNGGSGNIMCAVPSASISGCTIGTFAGATVAITLLPQTSVICTGLSSTQYVCQ